MIEALHFIDVIVIPFEPNNTDLSATLYFYNNIYKDILSARRKLGQKTTVRGAMNRVMPNVLEFKEIMANKSALPFELMDNYIKDSRVDYQRNLSTLSNAYHHPCDAFCEEVLELISNHIKINSHERKYIPGNEGSLDAKRKAEGAGGKGNDKCSGKSGNGNNGKQTFRMIEKL